MSSENTVLCGNCKKKVHFHLNPVNHGRQLLITLLTVGMWLPVWLTMAFCQTRYCDECDSPIWKD